jgi:DNA-binding MarR family transcriptional regulator
VSEGKVMMSDPVFDEEKRAKWFAFVQSLHPGVDPKAMRLMDEMRMTARILSHIGENSVVASGLSYAKFRLLMALFIAEDLEAHDGLNPSKISERQGTSRNTISALIRQLEDEGLVERTLDRQDRRKFNIRLSNAGRGLVHDHMRRHLRIIDSCFGTLDGEEQELLSQLLAKIRTSTEACYSRQTENSKHETGASNATN